jgi:heme exporter protein D
VFEFQFEGVRDFLNMGGYAFAVWVSYAFFALVVVWSLLQPRIERRKLLQLHKARMRREAGLTQRQNVTEQS